VAVKHKLTNCSCVDMQLKVYAYFYSMLLCLAVDPGLKFGWVHNITSIMC